jgi:transcriptional regulator GlxA family with amidase domain
LVFDARWLDGTPRLGNELTYSALTKLCDELLDDFQLHAGLAGKVREVLLRNLAQPMGFEEIARRLAMTPRTLRRRLQEENTSFRSVVDELRMRVAIKYLRDTELPIEHIAASLGFSETANFRHAFRRWTENAPSEFRRMLSGLRGQ